MTRHPARAQHDRLVRLCQALVADLGLVGATITLMVDDGSQGLMAASDPGVEAVDAVQFDVGEAPSREAFTTGLPVLAEDLADSEIRWPAFVALESPRGIGAVYALPVRHGGVRLGVLTAYADGPRALSVVEVGTCAAYAETATSIVLADLLHVALLIRTAVYQAQGMVRVDLHVDLAEAMACLRATAFAEGIALDKLAAEIVAGRRLAP